MVGEPRDRDDEACDAATRWIVVLGAAVWRDGVASPALRRRVAAAVAAAHADPRARVLPTGAIGRHPPSEAVVMRGMLLEAGIDAARITIEEEGTDTLSSLRLCARIVRAAGDGRIVVCTDAYHVPRCRAIAWALGLRAESVVAHGARDALGPRRFAMALVREGVALPWDVALAFLARVRG